MTLDANKVRIYLKRVGQSQEWLAAQLGCSINTVKNILAGKIPRGGTLVSLAKLMGCKVEDLIPSQAKRTA